MHVFVNGDRIRIDTDLLAEIVEALGFGDRKVVVAVNETFVAKTEWRSYQVRSEDRLDILSAMQGG
ncbi:MAG: sulfur carrier protein ThiS [Gammaproteobacteria bacterium]|nr:sulfur carrier protein ThiS [Gammaproteobacteria bacterium]